MADPQTFNDLRTIIERELGADVNNDMSVEITNSMHAAIRFYEGEPLWWLETDTSTSTTADDYTDALPTDAIAIEAIMMNSQWMVQGPIPFDRYNVLRTSTGFVKGVPQFYSMQAQNAWWHPQPDAVYSIDWYYWRRLPELGVNDSDEWITEAWRLIRSHVEEDLAVHLMHAPPQPPAQYAAAAERELLSLLKRSLGKVTYGQHRISQRLAELQAGKSRG